MRLLFLLAVLLPPTSAQAKPPPACSHWPVTMALASLKNAGAVDLSRLDENATKVTLLATERLPRGIFKEVHEITYSSKDGKQHITVITVNTSSNEECSISDVFTFIVSKELR